MGGLIESVLDVPADFVHASIGATPENEDSLGVFQGLDGALDVVSGEQENTFEENLRGAITLGIIDPEDDASNWFDAFGSQQPDAGFGLPGTQDPAEGGGFPWLEVVLVIALIFALGTLFDIDLGGSSA